MYLLEIENSLMKLKNIMLGQQNFSNITIFFKYLIESEFFGKIINNNFLI